MHSGTNTTPAVKASAEGRPEYIWFSYAKGSTEKETIILKMMESCGVHFSEVRLVQAHDYDDREYDRNTFHNLTELEAKMGDSLRLYDVKAYGMYKAAEVLVCFKDWNIFGGVHIRCRADNEDVVSHLLRDFEERFCKSEQSRAAVAETQCYNAVVNQPLGPFFPVDGPVLLHSVGSWKQDVEEAQRRMDLFFSTAEAFKFARQRGASGVCKGSFRTKCAYDYTFWSREYFHSHDGWDTEGEAATVIRISPKEFYNPSDPYYAKERVLALNGQQNKTDWLNGWGKITFDALWQVPEGLEKQEEERYYLAYNKFRAKNFLGMAGYFEVRWSGF